MSETVRTFTRDRVHPLTSQFVDTWLEKRRTVAPHPLPVQFGVIRTSDGIRFGGIKNVSGSDDVASMLRAFVAAFGGFGASWGSLYVEFDCADDSPLAIDGCDATSAVVFVTLDANDFVQRTAITVEIALAPIIEGDGEVEIIDDGAAYPNDEMTEVVESIKTMVHESLDALDDLFRTRPVLSGITQTLSDSGITQTLSDMRLCKTFSELLHPQGIRMIYVHPHNALVHAVIEDAAQSLGVEGVVITRRPGA